MSISPGGSVVRVVPLGNLLTGSMCRYLNATGIMWESAPGFGALLVFAEHRYYGLSKPYERTLRRHMHFLTSEQAMADYAVLIGELKAELHAHDSAVIGFGGSYGDTANPAAQMPCRPGTPAVQGSSRLLVETFPQYMHACVHAKGELTCL